MNPYGWQVSHKGDGISNPWTASHLADYITVHGETIDALGLEIRHEQNRRSFNARRNANGSR